MGGGQISFTNLAILTVWGYPVQRSRAGGHRIPGGTDGFLAKREMRTGILDTAIGDDRNIVRLAAISGPVELAVGANKVQLLHASKKGFWWKI